MASLSSILNSLMREPKGETMRDYFVEALQTLHSEERNAAYLNGQPAANYVTIQQFNSAKDELNNLIALCDQINGHSTIDTE